MKKLGLLILALPFLQQASAQFTLKGKITGIHMDSVMITYNNASAKYTHETYPISLNGEFTISGDVAHPTTATLLFKNKGEVISSRDREIRINYCLRPVP